MFATLTGTQRLALYFRVSSEEQAERGTIEGQRSFLREYARLMAHANESTVVDEYPDDGVSGTIRLADRPEGARLIADALNQKFDVVVVYRLDRLGRSLKVIMEAFETLEQLGVSVRSATEPFDTSQPIGRFMVQFLGAMAELDKANVLERFSIGRAQKNRQGRWIAGPVPYGYDLDAERPLVPSERWVEQTGTTESDLVRTLYQRIADGETVFGIQVWLNQLGVPATTRYRGIPDRINTKWHHSRLHNMFGNDIYYGLHVWDAKRGRVEAEVPALVPKSLWERVQERMTENRKFSRGSAKRDYLLRGLMKCKATLPSGEECGHSYTGVMNRARGEEFAAYRCAGQTGAFRDPTTKHLRCTSTQVRARTVEDYTWAQVKRIVQDPEVALERTRELVRDRLSQASQLDAQLRALQTQVGQRERDREKVLELLRRERITVDESDRELEKSQEEVSQIRVQIEKLRTQQRAASAFESQYSEVSSLLHKMRQQIALIESTGDTAAKRRLIEALVIEIGIYTYGEGRRKQARIEPLFAVGSVDPTDSGGRSGDDPGFNVAANQAGGVGAQAEARSGGAPPNVHARTVMLESTTAGCAGPSPA